jgi:chromosome segregation ATPase
VKKKHKKKKRSLNPGVSSEAMGDSLYEIEQILAASGSEPESAPRELRGIQAQLTRFAADIEAARRRLESVRPALAAARQRLALLEAAQPALVEARRRLYALEVAGAGLEQVHTRVRTLSPSLESARRALETTGAGMLPSTRQQVRQLATELDAVSRALAVPTPILEALRQRVRALEALEPLLVAARGEVEALEALVPVVETARHDLRALATDLEAPRRALDAAIGTFPGTRVTRGAVQVD